MNIANTNVKKSSNTYKKYLFTIGIFATFITLGFLANTLLFQDKINIFVRSYISTRNHHLADHIALHLEADNYFVKEFADVMEDIPEFYLNEEILNHESVGIELFKIAVVTKHDNQSVLYNGDEKLLEWVSHHDELWDKEMMTTYNNDYLVYSYPVVSNGIEHLALGLERYDEIYKDDSKEFKWEPFIHILVDKNNYETLITKVDGEKKLSDQGIEDIINIVKAEKDTNIIFKKDYVISFEEIKNTDWIQISVEKNTEYIDMFSNNVTLSFILIIVETLFFVILFRLSKKDLRRKEKIYLTDRLTGGYNRDGFIKESIKYLNKYPDSDYAIVCFNIYNFRRINELWTEDTGDQVIQFVYKYLNDTINNHELACRSSRDHFIILMNTVDKEVITTRVNKILEEINEKVHKNTKEYNIHFYVGVSRVYGNDVSGALSRALSASKQQEKVDVCHFYNEEIAQKIREENEVEELFEESLINHDFKIYLQPKVSRDGLCKAEALVRWIHPTRGIIYPDKFIPLLEKNGQIYKLDLYVFEEVCKLLSSWNQEDRIEISVNLSRFSLKEKGEYIWANYREIKEKYNIPDKLIEIELTETGMIEDEYVMNVVSKIIDGFKRNGFKIALDDFGMAYSSLAILKEFDVDTIKLDKSFFMDETGKSRMIVMNLIRLAHNLEICVVAEGIEIEEQCEFLWKSGCDYIQGYIYAKPLTIEEFIQWKNKR